MIHFLELPKLANKIEEDKLSKWLLFFKSYDKKSLGLRVVQVKGGTGQERFFFLRIAVA